MFFSLLLLLLLGCAHLQPTCTLPSATANLSAAIAASAHNGCTTLVLDSNAVYAVTTVTAIDTPRALTIRCNDPSPARVNLRETVRFLIVTNGANVSLVNVELHNGHAETDSGVSINGGTFYVSGDATQLWLANVAVLRSATLVGHGGAIYADSSASLDIRDSVFFNSTAAQGGGGAVCLRTGARAAIRNSYFSDNTAYISGGALHVGPGAYARVESSVLRRNRVLEGNGGATYSEINGFIEFSGTNGVCTNSALRGYGGGSFAAALDMLQWLPPATTTYAANRNGGLLSAESSTANVAPWPPYCTGGYAETLTNIASYCPVRTFAVLAR